MSNWMPIYICWRPDTKSKEPHARCRQHVFETTTALCDWLRARKNSTETVKVVWCPTAALKDEHEIVGRRCDLAKRDKWPMEYVI